MYKALKQAEKVIKVTGNEFTSSDKEFRLNTDHILRVWIELYPSENSSRDDRSVLLVEDIAGNIYVAKEQDDCCISDNHVSSFIGRLVE